METEEVLTLTSFLKKSAIYFHIYLQVFLTQVSVTVSVSQRGKRKA